MSEFQSVAPIPMDESPPFDPEKEGGAQKEREDG